MAKSTRSKVKRHFRAKKRQEGVYAAAEAARLNRLHQKLKVLTTKDQEETEEVSEFDEDAQGEGKPQQMDVQDGQPPADSSGDAMNIDSGSQAQSEKRISTHGPRGSRREEWRASKGLPPKKSRGMNRQGTIAAKRRPGRPHRRR
ncbi:hypothetical protein K474DRAFT_1769250 [Panus rudis PR-1116 ss-1]|nr:hypothetical protein K474DRAFT_1769250 [Panus rudis PR-1116 ss-1]